MAQHKKQRTPALASYYLPACNFDAEESVGEHIRSRNLAVEENYTLESD